MHFPPGRYTRYGRGFQRHGQHKCVAGTGMSDLGGGGESTPTSWPRARKASHLQRRVRHIWGATQRIWTGKSPSPPGSDIFGGDKFGQRCCIPRLAATQVMAADFRGAVDISVWPAHGCRISGAGKCMPTSWPRERKGSRLHRRLCQIGLPRRRAAGATTEAGGFWPASHLQRRGCGFGRGR